MKHFINLTNGLIFVPKLSGLPLTYIRIQSTALEQRRFSFVIEDLDHSFLLALATGDSCIVYDQGIKGITRAQWQGLPWIKYCCNLCWFGRPIPTFFRGHNATRIVGNEYGWLTKKALKKLKYYRKYVSDKLLGVELIPYYDLAGPWQFNIEEHPDGLST